MSRPISQKNKLVDFLIFLGGKTDEGKEKSFKTSVFSVSF
jgi:hypothetical protein